MQGYLSRDGEMRPLETISRSVTGEEPAGLGRQRVRLSKRQFSPKTPENAWTWDDSTHGGDFANETSREKWPPIAIERLAAASIKLKRLRTRSQFFPQQNEAIGRGVFWPNREPLNNAS